MLWSNEYLLYDQRDKGCPQYLFTLKYKDFNDNEKTSNHRTQERFREIKMEINNIGMETEQRLRGQIKGIKDDVSKILHMLQD